MTKDDDGAFVGSFVLGFMLSGVICIIICGVGFDNRDNKIKDLETRIQQI